MSQPPQQSDSSVSNSLEKALVGAVAEKLQAPLAAGTLSLDGCRVHLDGFFVNEADKNAIIVEAHASTEKHKLGCQRNILADILKLIYVHECLQEKHPEYKVQLYLAFSSKWAAEELRNFSWAARALEKFGIEVIVHPMRTESTPPLESAVSNHEVLVDQS